MQFFQEAFTILIFNISYIKNTFEMSLLERVSSYF